MADKFNILDTPDEPPALVWVAPTFVNGWVLFDTGNTWEDPAYTKDNQGFVHLRGLIKSGTVGVAAFFLPVGYRPNQRLIFPVRDDTGDGQIDIYPTGEVLVRSGTTNGWVSLSGILFAVA